MIDVANMTDDELSDIRRVVYAEIKRREAEPKKPVFIVDDDYYKDINQALAALIQDIELAKNHPGGPAQFLKSEIENERLVFGLTFEHWTLSEYNLRGEKTFGCSWSG
jgi:hypothetical protein